MLFGTGAGVRIALHRALWPSEGAGKLTSAGADGAHLPSVACPLCCWLLWIRIPFVSLWFGECVC